MFAAVTGPSGLNCRGWQHTHRGPGHLHPSPSRARAGFLDRCGPVRTAECVGAAGDQQAGPCFSTGWNLDSTTGVGAGAELCQPSLPTWIQQTSLPAGPLPFLVGLWGDQAHRRAAPPAGRRVDPGCGVHRTRRPGTWEEASRCTETERPQAETHQGENRKLKGSHSSRETETGRDMAQLAVHNVWQRLATESFISGSRLSRMRTEFDLCFSSLL